MSQVQLDSELLKGKLKAGRSLSIKKFKEDCKRFIFTQKLDLSPFYSYYSSS